MSVCSVLFFCSFDWSGGQFVFTSLIRNVCWWFCSRGNATITFHNSSTSFPKWSVSTSAVVFFVNHVRHTWDETLTVSFFVSSYVSDTSCRFDISILICRKPFAMFSEMGITKKEDKKSWAMLAKVMNLLFCPFVSSSYFMLSAALKAWANLLIGWENALRGSYWSLRPPVTLAGCHTSEQGYAVSCLTPQGQSILQPEVTFCSHSSASLVNWCCLICFSCRHAQPLPLLRICSQYSVL